VLVTYGALDTEPRIFTVRSVVGRQGGGDTAAGAEHGTAVTHIGNLELAILHQRRSHTSTTSRALHCKCACHTSVDNTLPTKLSLHQDHIYQQMQYSPHHQTMFYDYLAT
jgi:hypothetical protein